MHMRPAEAFLFLTESVFGRGRASVFWREDGRESRAKKTRKKQETREKRKQAKRKTAVRKKKMPGRGGGPALQSRRRGRPAVTFQRGTTACEATAIWEDSKSPATSVTNNYAILIARGQRKAANVSHAMPASLGARPNAQACSNMFRKSLVATRGAAPRATERRGA
jgi:Tfp pilus assembly protein PilX